MNGFVTRAVPARLGVLLLCALAAGFAVSCGGGGGSEDEKTTPTPTPGGLDLPADLSDEQKDAILHIKNLADEHGTARDLRLPEAAPRGRGARYHRGRRAVRGAGSAGEERRLRAGDRGRRAAVRQRHQGNGRRPRLAGGRPRARHAGNGRDSRVRGRCTWPRTGERSPSTTARGPSRSISRPSRAARWTRRTRTTVAGPGTASGPRSPGCPTRGTATWSIRSAVRV